MPQCLGTGMNHLKGHFIPASPVWRTPVNRCSHPTLCPVRHPWGRAQGLGRAEGSAQFGVPSRLGMRSQVVTVRGEDVRGSVQKPTRRGRPGKCYHQVAPWGRRPSVLGWGRPPAILQTQPAVPGPAQVSPLRGPQARGVGRALWTPALWPRTCILAMLDDKQGHARMQGQGRGGRTGLGAQERLPPGPGPLLTVPSAWRPSACCYFLRSGGDVAVPRAPSLTALSGCPGLPAVSGSRPIGWLPVRS